MRSALFVSITAALLFRIVPMTGEILAQNDTRISPPAPELYACR
jgi:hypothetical protein